MAYISKAKSIEWETPQDFFDKCNAEFNFTLDVASTDENAKCENHFTEKDDGLKCSWGGREYGAIHHTEEKCQNGSQKQTQKKTMQN